MKSLVTLAVALSGCLMLHVAASQEASLEPGVQTSPSASQPSPPVEAAAAAAAPSATAAPAATEVPSGGPPPAASTHASLPDAQPSAAATAPTPPGKAGTDRLQLGTTQISGNRELPKVMYVVPWRRAEIGDYVGRPNSLVDEALAPVDREVFQRQNRYYAALQSSAASAKSQPGAPGAHGAGAQPKDER